MFEMKKNQILISGYPKNDILSNSTQAYINKIKRALCLPKNKKIILYAPTFRENNMAITNVDVDFDLWEKELGETYTVLFRAHPVTRNAVNIPSNSLFVVDCSDYYDITDLYLVSDILVSDYSGVFFDFCNFGKAYDLLWIRL